MFHFVAIEFCNDLSEKLGVSHVVLKNPGTHTQESERSGYQVYSQEKVQEMIDTGGITKNSIVYNSTPNLTAFAKIHLSSLITQAKQDAVMYQQVFDILDKDDKYWLSISIMLRESKKKLNKKIARIIICGFFVVKYTYKNVTKEHLHERISVHHE